MFFYREGGYERARARARAAVGRWWVLKQGAPYIPKEAVAGGGPEKQGTVTATSENIPGGWGPKKQGTVTAGSENVAGCARAARAARDTCGGRRLLAHVAEATNARGGCGEWTVVQRGIGRDAKRKSSGGGSRKKQGTVTASSDVPPYYPASKRELVCGRAPTLGGSAVRRRRLHVPTPHHISRTRTSAPQDA